MNFGTFAPAQAKALKPFIEGRIVTDLGAGDFCLSQKVKRLGAAKVIAVDKEGCITGAVIGRTPHNVKCVRSYFADYLEPIDVALISWPVNWTVKGLVEAAGRAETVVYLGKNFGGAACGFPAFWRELVKREPLLYMPARSSTMIVYGPRLVVREPLGEEKAALDHGKVYEFEETCD